jgi:uncharacterized protein YkwD
MGRQFLGIFGVILLMSSLLVSAPAGDKKEDETKLDDKEAKNAFEYLNKVRSKPADYSKEIGADLKEVKPRDALKWNDILAKVAKEKAADMAKRNYFAHDTPEGLGINYLIHKAGYKLPEYMRKKKSDNFFESLGAGYSTGKEAIQGLIKDEFDKNLGHRKHLLGMTDFYAACTDIGIGIAHNPKSKYGTYVCIIIAKQK